MSILEQIHEMLKKEPSILLLEKKEHVLLPERSLAGDSHVVVFEVAPRLGLYTVDELNAFMGMLIPHLPVRARKDFHVNRRFDFMEFGNLQFEEEIGQETTRHEIVLHDKSLFSTEGFVEGKRVVEEVVKPLKRCVVVRLYPSEAVARVSLAKVCFGDQMTLRELGTFSTPVALIAN